MNKLAIVDIDGVLANSEARFAKAEEAKQAAIAKVSEDPFSFGLSVAQEKELTNLYWQTAFTPELVALDTLIDGANNALLDIQHVGYKVVFLTSRPYHMQEATKLWLFKNTVYDSDDELIMKAPAFQYTKTTVWKAGMVQTLASWYGASDLLIVEDEQTNIDEILKYVSFEVWTRQIFKSLQEAVNALAE